MGFSLNKDAFAEKEEDRGGGGGSPAGSSLSVFNLVGTSVSLTEGQSVQSCQCEQQQQSGRLEPWYSYTHWFPMASSHVLKPSLEPVPKMQPAMMMFSSKYWSRRGMSLDSAMFQQQQQRHTGGQMVRSSTPPYSHHPLPSWRVVGGEGRGGRSRWSCWSRWSPVQEPNGPSVLGRTRESRCCPVLSWFIDLA